MPPDPPGAGAFLQGGVRPGDRASPVPVQRAAASGEQRPVHRVQAEAAQLAAALEEDHPETHPRPPEKERSVLFLQCLQITLNGTDMKCGCH